MRVMRVSVLVPSFERPETLERCLRAVGEQTRPADEIIVACRAQDEPTLRLLASPALAELPLSPTAAPRPGLVAANNAGLEVAGGDVIAITDDDARPAPDWLERVVSTFSQDERIAAVGGRDRIWRSGQPLDADGATEVGRVQLFGRVVGNHHIGVGPARDVDFLKGVNMSLRRSALGSLRFDERLRGKGTQMNTELGVCLTLRAAGLRIVYDPSIRVDHFPAERPGGDRREAPSFKAAVDTVHNETLALLDFLPLPRRLLFAGWSVLIGTRGAPGFAQVVRTTLGGQPPRWTELPATLYGRWLGWRTHRRSKRNRTASQSLMATGNGKRLPIGWQVARLVTAGSSRQAFLDRRWISWALRAAPQNRRRGLALRLLSLSPHYFVYQWDGYPPEWDRDRVLEAEFERNRHSRQQIAESLLAPAVSPSARVLDFGCGPGFLARAMNERVQSVVALDISSGTLACARELNPGPTYKLARGAALPVEDGSIDVVYSIAVFQHIDPSDWPSHFDAFSRALRPGGRGLCHFAVADAKPIAYEQPRGPRGLYSLRFQESTSETVLDLLTGAGFVDIQVAPMRDRASIDDDVGQSHIASFWKPASPA